MVCHKFPEKTNKRIDSVINEAAWGIHELIIPTQFHQGSHCPEVTVPAQNIR